MAIHPYFSRVILYSFRKIFEVRSLKPAIKTLTLTLDVNPPRGLCLRSTLNRECFEF